MGNEAPRRRQRRWWLAGVLVVVVAWAVAASVIALDAKHHSEVGLGRVQRATSRATGDLDNLIDSLQPATTAAPSDIPALLRSATNDFRAASDSLHSKVLTPVLVLPWAGRQLRSARALSSAATTVSDAAADADGSLQGLLSTPTTDPTTRLAASRRAEAVLRRFRGRISKVDLGPRHALYATLATVRRRFVTQYDRLLSTVDQGIESVTGLNVFLTGPTDYLLLASNNGEMRAGAGSYLQVGELSITDGRFSIAGVAAARGLSLDQPGATLDPDVARNWGWLQPNQDWRNVNLTPRYDESARMATEMWATQHPPVQGALNIDIAGIKALLDVVGPVQVQGQTIGPDQIVQYLLVGQYQDFGDDVDVRPLRDEHLAEVAAAALEGFNTKPWSPADLMKSLLNAGKGRHIMLWSSTATEERAWKAVGASGEIPANGMMLSSISLGANKLDQFVAIEADLTIDRRSGDPHVHVAVKLTNHTPKGLPRYVQGPTRPGQTVAGEYVGLVMLTMPGSARGAATTGGQPTVKGKDGPSTVIGTPVAVQRDQTATVDFDFVVPKGSSQVDLLPSARLPATTWNLMDSGRRFSDGTEHHLGF